MKFVSTTAEWADENMRKLLSKLILCSEKKKITTRFLWRDELRKLGYWVLSSRTFQEMRIEFQVTLEVYYTELEN